MNDEKTTLWFRYKLQKIMRNKNLTQKDLARLSGLSEVTISRYICGSRIPTLTSITKLCVALECSPNDLIFNENG